MKMDFFPAPRKIAVSKKTLNIAAAEWVTIKDDFSTALKERIQAFCAEVAGVLGQPVRTGVPGGGAAWLTIQKARGTRPQGYELTVSAEGVTLEGADEAGLFYGLQTLAQLVASNGVELPCCKISDWPDFPARGVMLDVSRCKVPTMETLRGLIDTLARLKINQVQLYVEHTFAFSAHERVWREASPLTAEEIVQLDVYCAARFIELVPNLNSFGHFERWLKYPEYKAMAECPEGFEWPWGPRRTCGSTLKPDAANLKFLDALYQEYLPNFTSRLFNVGCDETWELGMGWSKKLAEKTSKTRVYLDFLLKIHKLTAKHGHRMMFWGDIILHEPALIKELPKDLIALCWGYEGDHPFDKQSQQFAASGIPFYVCPGTSSWTTLTGRTANCLENLANAAKYGLKHGALGYLNTDWGDGGHHQYQPISYLGLLAGACYSWACEANQKTDMVAGLNAVWFQDATGILGQVAYDLGKVLERSTERPGNSTIFNHLFFSEFQGAQTELIEKLEVPSLKKCLADFDRLAALIPLAQPGIPDGALVKAELRNSIRMARHGVEKAIAYLRSKSGKPGEGERLQRELVAIRGLHEALWLARNRRGGLEESLELLMSPYEALGRL